MSLKILAEKNSYLKVQFQIILQVASLCIGTFDTGIFNIGYFKAFNQVVFIIGKCSHSFPELGRYSDKCLQSETCHVC